MADQAGESLNFESASEKLFDPTGDRYLKKGRISDAHSATEEQISQAEAKLHRRRQDSDWSLFRPEDAEPFIKVLEQLIAEAKQVVRETAEGATSEAFALEGERQPDPRSPAVEEITAVIDAIRDRRAAWKKLPFYADGRLIHLGQTAAAEAKRLVFTKGDKQRTVLDGTSDRIHDLNKELPIALDDDNIEEYVAFFTEHVHGEGGPFLVIEEDRPQAETFPANLTVTTCDPREGENLKQKVAKFQQREQITHNRPYVERPFRAEIGWPLTCIGKDDQERWLIGGTVLYGDEIYRAVFAVEPNGMIEMVGDQQLNDPVFTRPQLAWPKKPQSQSKR